jgi:hypothetical protein
MSPGSKCRYVQQPIYLIEHTLTSIFLFQSYITSKYNQTIKRNRVSDTYFGWVMSSISKAFPNLLQESSWICKSPDSLHWFSWFSNDKGYKCVLKQSLTYEMKVTDTANSSSLKEVSAHSVVASSKLNIHQAWSRVQRKLHFGDLDFSWIKSSLSYSVYHSSILVFNKFFFSWIEGLPLHNFCVSRKIFLFSNY